jgi:hypothetical protein
MAPKKNAAAAAITAAAVSPTAVVAIPVATDAAPVAIAPTPKPRAPRQKAVVAATEPVAVAAELVQELSPEPAAVKRATGRRGRLPRLMREQVVFELDRITELLQTIAKTQRRAKVALGAEPVEVPVPATPREVAKQAVEMIKHVRASLRVRARRDGAERTPSAFNLFVRETMKDLKARGEVFDNTTARMKECGRLWKLAKDAKAAV